MTEPNLYDAGFKDGLNVGYDAGFEDGFKEAQPRIEELEANLAKAEWLLVDATVQLEEGKIKTRRNRAALIRQFLAELTGGKDD